MNRTRIFRLARILSVTILAGIALNAGASSVLGPSNAVSPAAQSAAPTILVNGPTGDRFTLVHSADGGWQMQAGWADQQSDNTARAIKTVYPMSPADAQPAIERPLTVFVDGPTGYTFIYLLDEGWKFVGSVADRNR